MLSARVLVRVSARVLVRVLARVLTRVSTTPLEWILQEYRSDDIMV